MRCEECGAHVDSRGRCGCHATYRVVRLTPLARRPARREYLRHPLVGGWTSSPGAAVAFSLALAEVLAEDFAATETEGHRFTTERVILAPANRGD